LAIDERRSPSSEGVHNQDPSTNAAIDFINAAYSISTIDNATGDKTRYQGALTRIQDKVATWIAHEYNPFLPMVNAETIIPALANNVDEGEQTKSSESSTLFGRLVRDMKSSGILDSGAIGHFLQKGVVIPTGRPSTKLVGIPSGHTVKAS